MFTFYGLAIATLFSWVVLAKFITICDEGISGGVQHLYGFVIYHA